MPPTAEEGSPVCRNRLASALTCWRRWGDRLHESLSPRLLEICALGALAGLAVVAFHEVVMWLEAHTIRRFASLPTGAFVGLSFVSVVGGSLLASAAVRWISPVAAAGGVLPTKLAFWRDFGVMRLRTAIAKFVASALTLGCGVSMGPEGPGIQIGAGLMSSAAGGLRVSKPERREFCAGGASAGLAAAFNAPLGAITFVLEEIVGDLNSRYLGAVVLAAVASAIVAHALLGAQPAFQVGVLGQPTWVGYALCPVVAAAAALAGGLFQRGALRLRGAGKRWQRLPEWSRPAIGAIGTWICGVGVFLGTGHLGIFGIGYQDVTAAIAGELGWHTAGLLFAGKLVATTLAVGFGACGGIFAPNFFIGALCGCALGGLSAQVLPLDAGDQSMLVMVGMCACLGAVIRTPLACILMIFEVTNQFTVVPALLLATLVSQGVSRWLSAHDMYEGQLLQDGIDPNQVLPPRHFKRWREMPASVLASFKPVVADDLRASALEALLAAHRLRRFPVLADGRVVGILTRGEAEAAIRESRLPGLEPVFWIGPKDSVAAAQQQLVASSTDLVCMGDEAGGQLTGVLTLHDLLRGQEAMLDGA